LDTMLAPSSARLKNVAVLEHVVTPLMQWVGNQWHQGALRIAHEHMATSSVRAHLERLYTSVRSDSDGPGIVLATLPGQRHEIGILISAVAAVMEGWRAYYFGLELPVAEIAMAAAEKQAAVVALSVSTLGIEQELHDQLATLRDSLPSGVQIVVGGAGTVSVKENAARLGIRCVERLDQFQDLLREYRSK
ncbi:MAG TPA: cobalamin-dependent protein, partial [Candidatus Hydrogenedentes bacterium]|nr:cobalamin-dependent protein [Candidatus Hydrogenedentota bacterium]